MEKYRRFEGISVPLLVSLVNGFINTYSFITQNRRFAGLQTGNMIIMTTHLMEKHYEESLSYLLPITFFIFGQVFSYFVRQWAKKRNLDWHVWGNRFLMICLLGIILFRETFSATTTLACLAFCSSVYLDLFKRIRGVNYANVMMTGNLRHLSWLLTKGFAENDKESLTNGFSLVLVLVSFVLGVAFGYSFSVWWQELALCVLFIPLLVIDFLLVTEK